MYLLQRTYDNTTVQTKLKHSGWRKSKPHSFEPRNRGAPLNFVIKLYTMLNLRHCATFQKKTCDPIFTRTIIIHLRHRQTTDKRHIMTTAELLQCNCNVRLKIRITNQRLEQFNVPWTTSQPCAKASGFSAVHADAKKQSQFLHIIIYWFNISIHRSNTTRMQVKVAMVYMIGDRD